MGVDRQLENWGDLELFDLVLAYRKAKVDCYYERAQCDAEAFAAFEGGLAKKLEALLQQLKSGQIQDLLNANLGVIEIVAKKLSVSKDPERANGHGYFSRPDRAFEFLRKTHTVIPEFRAIGRFPVVMHLLSALWINLVGHRFDSALDRSVRGARLRRYCAAEPGTSRESGRYHVEGIGSFQPYFRPYRKWRSDGMRASRLSLEDERPVIAVSLDISNYYHRVDPTFIASPDFQKAIGVELNAFESKFTGALAAALKRWSEKVVLELSAFGCNGEPLMGGLPIGLSCTRIIANVLLHELDRQIQHGLAPLYYGRYVDDILLVLVDTGYAADAEQLFAYVAHRVPCMVRIPGTESSPSRIEIQFPQEYAGTSKLELQEKKQKVFFLEGRAGLDLLDSIELEISRVASERRLMPDPEELESSASAKVLTAAGDVADEADTLRRADGLSVRRLGWSIQLRNVETLARDLLKNDWSEQRHAFYQFAHNHILRPDRILDHVDYLPRLLSLAISLEDYSEASGLLTAAVRSIQELFASTTVFKINGYSSKEDSTWVCMAVDEHVRRVCRDAVLRALPCKRGVVPDLLSMAPELCSLLPIAESAAELRRRALDLREADLAKTPYKVHIRREASLLRSAQGDENTLLDVFWAKAQLAEFLSASESKPDVPPSHHRVHPGCTVPSEAESRLPYLFPTRPYTAQEIALFVPRCIASEDSEGDNCWARYVQGVRGSWVRPTLRKQAPGLPRKQSIDPGTGRVRPAVWPIGSHRNPEVRLGITSLLTTEGAWRMMADGTSDVGKERYRRIEKIVNEAIKARPSVSHLLLPELALPERWLQTVSDRLRDAGISLLAGLDYMHDVGASTVYSEAVLVLTDDRLGFPAMVEIRQPKTKPAPGEEEELLAKFGKRWLPIKHSKPVYSHDGFHFGVLVCSELQNIAYRSVFQGNVDCLMILSWNRDLETFSALVESAALDVHSYVALVNNRRYGDSRVRSPAKESYMRDLCRIQGGLNDYLVVVSLDIASLREFQSRANAWPRDDDPFKPVPEGFDLDPLRRRTPK